MTSPNFTMRSAEAHFNAMINMALTIHFVSYIDNICVICVLYP